MKMSPLGRPRSGAHNGKTFIDEQKRTAPIGDNEASKSQVGEFSGGSRVARSELPPGQADMATLSGPRGCRVGASWAGALRESGQRGQSPGADIGSLSRALS